MVLDPKRDEEERTRYELEDGYRTAREFEEFKRAVDMCIAAGFLTRAKLDEALAFIRGSHR